MSKHYKSLMNGIAGPDIAIMMDALIKQPSFFERAVEMLGKGRDGFETALQYLMWGLYGRHGQTFEVGPMVMDMLCSLDAREVPLDDADFFPPYPSFYIELTEVPDHWQIWGGLSGWHHVRGMYVCFWQHIFQEEGVNLDWMQVGSFDDIPISVCLIGKGYNLKEIREAGLEVTEDHLEMAGYGMGDSEILEDATFRFHVPSGVDLHKLFLKDWQDNPPAHNTFGTGMDLLLNADKSVLPPPDCLTEVSRLVINLCLYLNSYNPETEQVEHGPDMDRLDRLRDKIQRTKSHKPQHKKIQRQIAKELANGYVTKVAPRLEEDLRSTLPSLGSGGKRRLHDVRAHKQRYWYKDEATGQMRRYWKFKTKYERGVDLGMAVREKYVVK